MSTRDVVIGVVAAAVLAAAWRYINHLRQVS